MGWVARRDLLARGPCSSTEAVVVGIVLALLATAVYASHIAHGGFLSDDWLVSADYQRASQSHGFFGIVREMASDPRFSGRRLAAPYFAVVSGVLGVHAHLYLAWVVLLWTMVAVLVFALLRALGVERLHAFMVAALVLVFPASDSTRLWAVGGEAEASILLYLAGTFFALRALRSSGRAGFVLHACAVGLYLMSVMLYEIAAAAVVLGLLLYRVRTSWRNAVIPWAAAVVSVAIALADYGRQRDDTGKTTAHGFQGNVDHAREIARQARLVLISVGVPGGAIRGPTWLGLFLVVSSVVVWRRLRATEPRSSADLGRWLVMTAGGLLALAAGYAVVVPADRAYYEPLASGFANRVNAFASIGFALTLYSFAVLIGLLVFRGLPGGRRSAAIAALILGGFLWATWAERVRSDATAYNAAASINRETLEFIRRAIPKPASETTLYLFGTPNETGPGVQAFAAPWDFDGAVQLLWRDPSLHGIPWPSISGSFLPDPSGARGIGCAAHELLPRGRYYGLQDTSPYGRASLYAKASPYGKAIFIDMRVKSYAVIRSQTECRAAVARLVTPIIE